MTPFDPDVPETVCLGAEVRLSCFDQVWARAEIVGLGHEVTLDTLGQAIADAVTATGQATGTWNAGTQEVEFAFSDAFFEQIACCTFTVSISHYVGSRLGNCPEDAVPEENLEFDVSVDYPIGNVVVDCCPPEECVEDLTLVISMADGLPHGLGFGITSSFLEQGELCGRIIPGTNLYDEGFPSAEAYLSVWAERQGIPEAYRPAYTVVGDRLTVDGNLLYDLILAEEGQEAADRMRLEFCTGLCLEYYYAEGAETPSIKCWRGLVRIIRRPVCCWENEGPIPVDPEPGCCWEPSWLYQQRHRMFTWLNARTVRSVLETWKRIGYGMGDEMEKNVRTAKELHRLALYLYSVLYRIQCYGGTWCDYVTREEIRCWLDRFFCLGVDVRCLFQMTGIGDFVDCCDPPLLDPLCPCIDDVPDNLPTESFVFDINDGDQGVNLSAPIEYLCCDGSTEACITNVQAPSPAVIGVRLDVTQWCQANGYSFDLDFNSTTAVAGQSGDYVVTWLICGREVRKIVRVRVVDTCRNRFPNSLPIIYKTFDKNISVPFDEYDATVDIENFECCGADGETVEILSIIPPSVGAGLGVQYEYPSPGDVINGTSVGFNFIFHPTDATAGARGDFKVRMRLCGEREIEQIFRFDVVDTCVPTDLQDPEITPVTLTEGDSGQLFTAEIPLTDVNCCTGGNDIVTVVNVVPPIERISGIRVLSPTTGQTYVAPSGIIRVEWLFDMDIAPDFTPGSYTITVQVRSCGGRIVNIPIRMDIALTTPCGDIVQGGFGNSSETYSTGGAGRIVLAYDTFTQADPVRLAYGEPPSETTIAQTTGNVAGGGYLSGNTPVNRATVELTTSNWVYKLFCVDTIPETPEQGVFNINPVYKRYQFIESGVDTGTYAAFDAVLLQTPPAGGKLHVAFEVTLNPTPVMDDASMTGDGGIGYRISLHAVPASASLENVIVDGCIAPNTSANPGDTCAANYSSMVPGNLGATATGSLTAMESGYLEVDAPAGYVGLLIVTASDRRNSANVAVSGALRPSPQASPAPLTATSIPSGDTLAFTPTHLP